VTYLFLTCHHAAGEANSTLYLKVEIRLASRHKITTTYSQLLVLKIVVLYNVTLEYTPPYRRDNGAIQSARVTQLMPRDASGRGLQKQHFDYRVPRVKAHHSRVAGSPTLQMYTPERKSDAYLLSRLWNMVTTVAHTSNDEEIVHCHVGVNVTLLRWYPRSPSRCEPLERRTPNTRDVKPSLMRLGIAAPRQVLELNAFSCQARVL